MVTFLISSAWATQSCEELFRLNPDALSLPWLNLSTVSWRNPPRVPKNFRSPISTGFFQRLRGNTAAQFLYQVRHDGSFRIPSNYYDQTLKLASRILSEQGIGFEYFNDPGPVGFEITPRERGAFPNQISALLRKINPKLKFVYSPVYHRSSALKRLWTSGVGVATLESAGLVLREDGAVILQASHLFAATGKMTSSEKHEIVHFLLNHLQSIGVDIGLYSPVLEVEQGSHGRVSTGSKANPSRVSYQELITYATQIQEMIAEIINFDPKSSDAKVALQELNNHIESFEDISGVISRRNREVIAMLTSNELLADEVVNVNGILKIKILVRDGLALTIPIHGSHETTLANTIVSTSDGELDARRGLTLAVIARLEKIDLAIQSVSQILRKSIEPFTANGDWNPELIERAQDSAALLAQMNRDFLTLFYRTNPPLPNSQAEPGQLFLRMSGFISLQEIYSVDAYVEKILSLLRNNQ